MSGENISELQRAVEILNNGGVIVYPTETVYGIGCDPLDHEAYDRIQTLKGRGSDKTMLLLASSLKQVESFAGELSLQVKRAADAFWPGPLTIVLRTSKPLPDYLYGPGGGVAFRVTPHPLACSLAESFGSPITSTSANLSGGAPAADYDEAVDYFEDKVDMILKNPQNTAGIPSTVIDMSADSIRILREGAISKGRIDEVL